MSFLDPVFLVFFAIFLVLGSFFSFSGKKYLNLLVAANLLYLGLRGWFGFIVIAVDVLLCLLCASHKEKFADKRLLWFTIALKTGFFVAVNYFAGHGVPYSVPIGYSFYYLISTAFLFELSKSTVISLQATPNLITLLFFPTATAGPIVDIQSMQGQIETIRQNQYDLRNLFIGIFWISLGLAKRTISEFASFVAKGNLELELLSPSLMAWIKLIAFAAKYYADFAGYSDIALGVAQMSGFQIQKNFERPFLATTVSEFWRRWHCSFNRWLKKYVFDPICFSEVWIRIEKVLDGKLRKNFFGLRIYIAIFLTMAFAGIWHGLTLCFLFWAMYIAILICIETALNFRGFKSWIFSIGLTFFFVLHSFLFYMHTNISNVWKFVKVMYSFEIGDKPEAVTAFAGGALLTLVIPHALDHVFHRYPIYKQNVFTTITITVLFLLFHYLFLGYSGAGFVYFRF